jgi:hypothetical protein
LNESVLFAASTCQSRANAASGSSIASEIKKRDMRNLLFFPFSRFAGEGAEGG